MKAEVEFSVDRMSLDESRDWYGYSGRLKREILSMLLNAIMCIIQYIRYR
jgi:hypothetical protein